MARSSKVDPCLFCGQAPCVCNAKLAKKSPKHDPEVAVMRERAARRRAATPVAVPPPPTVSPDDLELAPAVAALAARGLLAPHEVRRHQRLIDLASGKSPELDRQILEWKKRHGPSR